MTEQSNGGRRWTLSGHETPTGTPYHHVDGPRLCENDRVEVMPVSEHRRIVNAAKCRCAVQITHGKMQRFWYAEYVKLRRAAEKIPDKPDDLRSVLATVTYDEISKGTRS